MEDRPLQVSVRLDASTFQRFALFDTWIRRKAWRSPALFALILLGAALICFLLRDRAQGAVLLGSVLTAVGLGLPLCYGLAFTLSVRNQVRSLGLDRPREVYTLCFDREGVEVTNLQESVRLPWEELYAAYRRKGCIYLYATPGRAFLLPADQIPQGEQSLWTLLTQRLSPGRTFL